MVTIKRGDTLSFIIRRTNELDQPQTGVANKLKSQIRDKEENLIASFIITETDEPGDYLFLVPAEKTRLFQIGTYFFDVEFTDNDIVSSSETALIRVVKDYTQ